MSNSLILLLPVFRFLRASKRLANCRVQRGVGFFFLSFSFIYFEGDLFDLHPMLFFFCLSFCREILFAVWFKVVIKESPIRGKKNFDLAPMPPYVQCGHPKVLFNQRKQKKQNKNLSHLHNFEIEVFKIWKKDHERKQTRCVNRNDQRRRRPVSILVLLSDTLMFLLFFVVVVVVVAPQSYIVNSSM